MKNGLDFIPKMYRERVEALETETGLIESCKYMLYLADGWFFADGGSTMPVKSKREAYDFIRKATKN